MAAGLCLFLPVVGRRNAGVKFYRLVLILSAVLLIGAAISHGLASRPRLAWFDAGAFASILFLYLVLRYPKRLIYRAATVLSAGALIVATVLAYHGAIRPSSFLWSVLAALAATAILGSVNMAMLLGHWYLVVRGMPIEPLKRLTIAFLISTSARALLMTVVLFLVSEPELYRITIAQGIFFWMRVGWGILGALVLYPMIWGTVKIRSTMAATGILYVAVVAVIIGEVLSTYLSALMRLPL